MIEGSLLAIIPFAAPAEVADSLRLSAVIIPHLKLCWVSSRLLLDYDCSLLSGSQGNLVLNTRLPLKLIPGLSRLRYGKWKKGPLLHW